MGQTKYTSGQALAIAKRIWDKYRIPIAKASGDYGVPQWYLAGLTGMENPGCYEYPSPRSYRFERGVYGKFKAVQSWANPLRWSYNGIKYSMIKGMTDDALRNLATSFGQTQIMAYYVLTILSGTTIAQLRDPNLHYNYSCKFMRDDPLLSKFLRSNNFAQICHIWNSGRVWNGKANGMKTYSPYYMWNCEQVMSHYKKLVSTHGTPSVPIVPKVPSAETSTIVDNLIDVPDIKSEENMNIFENDYGNDYSDPGLNLPVPIGSDQGPSIVPKAGYKTSQGILTILFIILSGGLSILGWSYSPEQIEGLYEKIVSLISIVAPIATAVPVLISYINSRGKIQSNSIWANTTLESIGQLPSSQYLPETGQQILGQYLQRPYVEGQFAPSIPGQLMEHTGLAIEDTLKAINTLGDIIQGQKEEKKELTDMVNSENQRLQKIISSKEVEVMNKEIEIQRLNVAIDEAQKPITTEITVDSGVPKQVLAQATPINEQEGE